MNMDATTDILSPRAREILGLNSSAYLRLVVHGPGNDQAKSMLEDLSPKDIFSEPSAKSDEDAKAAQAGLWLLHDWLDESHTISQSIHSATGSFWHAIMHRREGDFSNSKYWYARAAGHPALQTLAAQATPVVNEAPAEKALLRLIASGWNPNAFVDLVESVSGGEGDACHSLAVQLQQLEWRVLWESCTRAT
jgi:hypothetical protein